MKFIENIFTSTIKKFSIESFSPELIKLINRIYDKDFKLFGYNKIVLQPFAITEGYNNKSI